MIYCYRRIDNNELVEIEMSPDGKERREFRDTGKRGFIVIDAVLAKRDYVSEHEAEKVIGNIWRDHASDALGIHPAQIPEEMKRIGGMGISGVNFDEEGRPHFDSKSSWKKYLKSRDMRDKSSYC